MREEQVTKAILKWLIDNNWEIVCFDFPQSGTGRFLHPNETVEKNKGSINPDIVAVKNNTCVFFENKDRHYHLDFEKINDLIVYDDYSDAINELLNGYIIKHLYYGIGIPESKFTTSAVADCELVDFVIGVTADYRIIELYFSEDKISPFTNTIEEQKY